MGKNPVYNRRRIIVSIQKSLEKRYHMKFYHYGVWTNLLDNAIVTALQYELSLRNPSKQIRVDGFYTEKLSFRLPILKRGHKNRYVFLMQCLLFKHGYRIKLDGNYQNKTQTSLEKFFTDNQIHLKTDEVSLLTWHTLLTHNQKDRNASFFECNAILGGKVRNGENRS